MAGYNKFNFFTEDLVEGVHDFDAHTFKVMLTLTAPLATNRLKSELTEIASTGSYAAQTTTITTSNITGTTTAKVVGTDVEFTASGGSIGAFRYAVLYNDTTTALVDPLIAWWDYGNNLTLASGEKLTVDFDGTNGIFQIT
jgi:hypothetical protein